MEIFLGLVAAFLGMIGLIVGATIGAVGTFLMESQRAKWSEERERRSRWETTQQQWMLDLQDSCVNLVGTLHYYLIEFGRPTSRSEGGLTDRTMKREQLSNELVRLSGRLKVLSSRLAYQDTLINQTDWVYEDITSVIGANDSKDARKFAMNAIQKLGKVNKQIGRILQEKELTTNEI
jgi:hypothetical protein